MAPKKRKVIEQAQPKITDGLKQQRRSNRVSNASSGIKNKQAAESPVTEISTAVEGVKKKKVDHNQEKGLTSVDREAKAINKEERQRQEVALLKGFDLDPKYGPCIGISRLQRWDRAERSGLNPPKKVRSLIEANEKNPEYSENLWNGVL
eukprot:Nk52_evm28s156 gene=Nk52_evmTU28s156